MYLIRIVLADDHAVLRSGLKKLLDAEPGMRVVGEAGDGETGARLVRELCPDVAIVDLSMPLLDGTQVIREALNAHPGLRVVGISAGGGVAAARLREAGAQAFVAKEAAFEQLADAVRAVASGRRFPFPKTDRPPDDGANGVILSPRDREVARFMAEGLATKQIAMQLRVSVKTVETHRRRMMQKLALESVAEVTKYALREGLTTLN